MEGSQNKYSNLHNRELSADYAYNGVVVNQAIQKSFADLRNSANLTVADTAAFLRLPEEEIIAFENGIKKPNIENLLALKGLSLVNIRPEQADYKFIDLFAGIGGFHLALHTLGAECVFASEINPYARKTYEHNHKKISPDLFKTNNFAGDIKSVSPENIPDFDILCGGFPCQPFSQAGYKRGFKETKDDRGNLFFDIIRIIQAKNAGK